MSHLEFAPQPSLPRKNNIRDECGCGRFAFSVTRLLSTHPTRCARWSASCAASAQAREPLATEDRQLRRAGRRKSNRRGARVAGWAERDKSFPRPFRQLGPKLAEAAESCTLPRISPDFVIRKFLAGHTAPQPRESCWRDRQSCSLDDHGLIMESPRAGSLRRQNSSNREQNRIYELIIHQHRAGIQHINSQQQRPEPAKMWVREGAVHLIRNCAHLSKAEQADHQPDVQAEGEHPAFHGNFQKSVMKYVVLGMEVADPSLNFCLNIVRATPA